MTALTVSLDLSPYEIAGDERAGAVFSTDRRLRYLLWRIWDRDAPFLHVCGLNPATADDKRLDATCTRCRVRAERAGFGGYVMTNLSPFRSVDPWQLFRGVATMDEVDGGVLNEVMIAGHARIAGMTIVAWGDFGRKLPQLPRVLKLLRDTGVPLYCLGTTRSGQPRHPSRLAYAVQPELYAA